MRHGPYPRWAHHLQQHLAAGSWADWADSGLRRSARTLASTGRHWGWAVAGRSCNSCQRGNLPCGMSRSIQWPYECSQLPVTKVLPLRSTTQYLQGRERNVLSAGCHWHNLSVVRWINMRWEPCSGGIPWSNTGGRAIPPLLGHEACSKEYGEDKFHCTSQLRNHEYRLGQARYRKGERFLRAPMRRSNISFMLATHDGWASLLWEGAMWHLSNMCRASARRDPPRTHVHWGRHRSKKLSQASALSVAM